MNPLELSVKDICQRNFRRDPSWRVPKGLEFSRQVRLRKSNKSPTSFGAFDALPSPKTMRVRACAPLTKKFPLF
jgi:hypothetical protein